MATVDKPIVARRTVQLQDAREIYLSDGLQTITFRTVSGTIRAYDLLLAKLGLTGADPKEKVNTLYQKFEKDLITYKK